jgi:DMSO reductase anchor subunit
MINRPITEQESKQLHRIESLLKLRMVSLYVAVVGIGAFYLLSPRNAAVAAALAIVVFVILFGHMIYLACFLRCPRCSGWIAMPKCPGCGLGLEKPGSGD